MSDWAGHTWIRCVHSVRMRRDLTELTSSKQVLENRPGVSSSALVESLQPLLGHCHFTHPSCSGHRRFQSLDLWKLPLRTEITLVVCPSPVKSLMKILEMNSKQPEKQSKLLYLLFLFVSSNKKHGGVMGFVKGFAVFKQTVVECLISPGGLVLVVFDGSLLHPQT